MVGPASMQVTHLNTQMRRCFLLSWIWKSPDEWYEAHMHRSLPRPKIAEFTLQSCSQYCTNRKGILVPWSKTNSEIISQKETEE
jgi:hypothetical protein